MKASTFLDRKAEQYGIEENQKPVIEQMIRNAEDTHQLVRMLESMSDDFDEDLIREFAWEAFWMVDREIKLSSKIECKWIAKIANDIANRFQDRISRHEMEEMGRKERVICQGDYHYSLYLRAWHDDDLLDIRNYIVTEYGHYPEIRNRSLVFRNPFN